jgi:uncharacterized protein YcfL
MRTLILCIIAAVLLAACSNEPEYTDQQQACIARQYKIYDRKQIDQCLNVCKSCMSGTTTTCTTSCKLKGAS